MRRPVHLLVCLAAVTTFLAPAIGHTIPGDGCAVSSDTSTLWPPNHKLHTVTLTGTDTCNDVNIDGVFQDEATNAKGSGHTIGNDAANCDNSGSNTAAVDLRAERTGLRDLGIADGRVYRIHWSSTLGDSGDVYVTVPHDKGHAGPATGDSGAAAVPSGVMCS